MLGVSPPLHWVVGLLMTAKVAIHSLNPNPPIKQSLFLHLQTLVGHVNGFANRPLAEVIQ